jgi:hypothetical protein
MEEQNENADVYRQDQNKQVRVDDMEIMGSWGSQVVIGSRNVRAIQVAGDASGDVYHIVSRSEKESFAHIQTVALEQDLPEEQREALEEALEDIREEIAKGKEANESWLNYLFSAVSEISPKTLAMLTDWILGHDDIPNKVRMLARNARGHRGR